mmetsp:Transcript_13560/g.24507  ORF Transcript_13560/g.24507 Transcript_13560/m.24507 type:complete len:100 (+) Transcript_13560:494-793(+)
MGLQYFGTGEMCDCASMHESITGDVSSLSLGESFVVHCEAHVSLNPTNIHMAICTMNALVNQNPMSLGESYAKINQTRTILDVFLFYSGCISISQLVFL